MGSGRRRKSENLYRALPRVARNFWCHFPAINGMWTSKPQRPITRLRLFIEPSLTACRVYTESSATQTIEFSKLLQVVILSKKLFLVAQDNCSVLSCSKAIVDGSSSLLTHTYATLEYLKVSSTTLSSRCFSWLLFSRPLPGSRRKEKNSWVGKKWKQCERRSERKVCHRAAVDYFV